MNNRIYLGDCISVLDELIKDGAKVDLTVTSPPYDNLRNYNGYNFDFENIAKGLYRIMKPNGVVVWVVGDKIINGNKTLTSFKQCLYFQEIGFKVHDVMIYKKKNTPFMRSNAYTNSFEFMFVLAKGKIETFNPLKTKTARSGEEMLVANKKADGVNKKVKGCLNSEKTLTNIWEYAVGLGGSTNDKIAFKHPAIFPEKLVRDHIISWTNEGDIVLDPFSGSGTTCKVAKLLHRHYIGFEISKEYIEISKQRLSLYDNALF
jgi:site-specific DNA-methyltransferase (adenine-specific)